MKKILLIFLLALPMHNNIFSQSMYTNGKGLALSAGAAMVNIYRRHTVYPSYTGTIGVSLFGYIDLGAEVLSFNGLSGGYAKARSSYYIDINVRNQPVGALINVSYAGVVPDNNLSVGATFYKRIEIQNSEILNYIIPELHFGYIISEYMSTGIGFAIQKDLNEHFGLVLTPGISGVFNVVNSENYYNNSLQLFLGLEVVIH